MQAEALNNVIKFLRFRQTGLDIWVYTGYIYDEVKDLPVMQMIDVLVDGPFIAEKKSLNCAFRGSSNQRVIEIKSGKLLF